MREKILERLAYLQSERDNEGRSGSLRTSLIDSAIQELNWVIEIMDNEHGSDEEN